MGLSEEIQDFFTYSNMQEELHAVVVVCQKWDNHIPQRQAQKAAKH